MGCHFALDNLDLPQFMEHSPLSDSMIEYEIQ